MSIHAAPQEFGTSNPGIVAERTKRVKNHINIWSQFIFAVKFQNNLLY